MISQLIKYFIKRKKFFLIPIIFFVGILAVVGIVGQGSIYSPFIYTIF